MEPWLLVIVIIVGIYLLLLVTNVIFVVSFYVIMKKHDRAINIILRSKYDGLKQMVKLLEKNEITISNEIKKLTEEIDEVLLEDLKVNVYEDIKKKLSYLKSLIYSAVEENEQIKQTDEFELIDDNISQLDNVYRTNVIMYNADVLGYNYWVRFLPCRYIWLIFRFKLKDLIS